MTIQQETTIYFYSRKLTLQKPTTIFAKPMTMIALPYARVYKLYNVRAREKNEYATASKTNMKQHLKRSYF